MSAAMRRPLVGLHLTVAFTSRESWLADFSLNHRAKETLLLHLAQLREGSGDGRSVVAHKATWEGGGAAATIDG